MDINATMRSNIASVRQALSMHSIEQSMNRGGATVNKLLEGMEETNKAIQHAIESHKGNNIDVRV